MNTPSQESPSQEQLSPPALEKPLPNIKLSDDVKDIANVLIKQLSLPNPTDSDILLAMLYINRLFTPLDALLKKVDIPAKTLFSKLKAHKEQNSVTPSEKPQPSSKPEDWPLIQQASRIQNPAELTDLIEAMCDSSDPVLQQLFTETGITKDKIQAAKPQIAKSQPLRSLLFFTREMTEVILFVLTFVIIIRNGLGEIRLIPSESMIPTLQKEDRVVIERLSHWVRPYQRGDVLVFYPPMTKLNNDPVSIFLRLTGISGLIFKKEDYIDLAYIKRLVGVPGDTIDIRPGQGVFINGKLLKEPYVSEVPVTCSFEPNFITKNPKTQQVHLFFHTRQGANIPDLKNPDMQIWAFTQKNGVLENAKLFPVTQMDSLLRQQNLEAAGNVCGPFVVPKGHYFMMGDNRGSSLDSRFWGFEPEERVIGRAFYRIWPISRMATLDTPQY